MDKPSWHSNNKIRHVVIPRQENRSFGQYFGSFATALGKAGDRSAYQQLLGV